MKKTIKQSISEMKQLSTRIPKTINEAINFQEGGDMETQDEPMDDVSAEEPMDEPKEESGMDVMAFVDDIRKKSLKGMAQLADNPDDERYQLLKKIWQICDKKPEQQTAFNRPGQQPMQQQMQPMQGSTM